MFVYEVKKTIGAYAAAMCGVDVIAFIGGIGENSAALRARCCEGMGFLGKFEVITLSTNEEIIVARRAIKILQVNEKRHYAKKRH